MHNQFRVTDVALPFACVRDPGIDRADRLNLVGFGVSPSPPLAEQIARYGDGFGIRPTEIFRSDMQGEYQRLASCLHYILSGIDPDEEASGSSALHDLTASRKTVRGGGYPIAADARLIADILQAE
ncbi:hypothetical protein ANO14919_066650 [Xylariales sp. No.14919]|nr:hypothetical protein ANO14919_066650 [Xylariales sp. No.14919]